MIQETNGWSIVYESAEKNDGSLFFPEKLSRGFLDQARRSMGSYLYANQFMNKIIPEDAQSFKKEWFRYYEQIPKNVYNFAMIDPAIGQEDGHDYTGITVISVDSDTKWYLQMAKRERMTPTQIVDACFDLTATFNLMGIGVEAVAYQKVLIFLISEEMRKRKKTIPLREVHPGTDKTKEMRIRGLIPRYEWGQILHSQGLYDLEMELLQFPRASHDDICDSLSLLEKIVTYPEKEKESNVKPNPADASAYERWFIKNIQRARSREDSE